MYLDKILNQYKILLLEEYLKIHKKYLLLLYFLFSIQFIFCNDNNVFHGVSTIPYPIDTMRALDWGYKSGYMDKIELIGWSRNSLIAYRYIDDGGGYGGFNHHFVIVNTINDENIEQDYFNSLDINTQEKIDTYKEKWNTLLRKYNITGEIIDPCAKIIDSNVMEFPSGNYRCWFDYSCLISEEIPVYNWELIIGNEYVQKTVTHQITRNLILVRIKIIGYFKSPFENRIVIFLSSASTFSGNVYFTPSLYGCNMNIGLN